MPSLFVINYQNGVPAYRQLIDQIKFLISAGILPAGAEMTSTRTLSAELSLNPMTIGKAYSILEREGVLERRRGQTLVVRAVAPAEQESNKLDPLRQHFAAAVVMARQLKISREQALKLFRETFDLFSL
ncbi:MAG TPA: GntR family transcriptional regulator [Opitutaceae bacterium]|jgi:GntR family transcriptional regulator